MCHTYNLECPLCDKTTLQLFYCAELTGRRAQYNAQQAANASTNANRSGTNPAATNSNANPNSITTTTSDHVATHTTSTTSPIHQTTSPPEQKPTESDCPSFDPDAEAIVPSISYSVPTHTAWSHVCHFCDFEFWNLLDANDEGGQEAWSDEYERKRIAAVRAERAKGRREKRWVGPF